MCSQYLDLCLLCLYVFIASKCVGLMCFHQPYCKVCNAQVQTKNNGNKSVSATRWYHESLLCYASRFYDRLAARRIFCRHCKQDHRRWRKSNPELLAYFSFWQICFATFKLQPPTVSAHLSIRHANNLGFAFKINLFIQLSFSSLQRSLLSPFYRCHQ